MAAKPVLLARLEELPDLLASLEQHVQLLVYLVQSVVGALVLDDLLGGLLATALWYLMFEPGKQSLHLSCRGGARGGARGGSKWEE
jgi:hypothetical protein